MGDMMPYLLEKGGTFRIFEEYLNTARAKRRAFLEVVRNSYKANDLAGQLNWFVQGPPGLWSDPSVRSEASAGQSAGLDRAPGARPPDREVVRLREGQHRPIG